MRIALSADNNDGLLLLSPIPSTRSTSRAQCPGSSTIVASTSCSLVAWAGEPWTSSANSGSKR